MNPADPTGLLLKLCKVQRVRLCDFHPQLLKRKAVQSKRGRLDGPYKHPKIEVRIPTYDA